MKPAEIVAMRKSLDITQIQLAALMGVERTVVWKWEAGRTEPTDYEAAKMEAFARKKHPKRFRVSGLLMRYGPIRVLTMLL